MLDWEGCRASVFTYSPPTKKYQKTQNPENPTPLMTILATICEIIHGNKLLLQKKSVGRFGEGKWNSAGGKVNLGETPLEGVIREVKEETGLTVSGLTHHGVIDFYFGEGEIDWIVHIFSTKTFEGELVESEEGELRWFNIDDIPYQNMWQDDVYWMPLMLEGKKFKAAFWFNEEGTELIKHELEVLGHLDFEDLVAEHAGGASK